MNPANARKLKTALTGYGFLSFNIAGFLVFTAIPVIASFILSFYKYDNINPAKFVGLGNYTHLLGWHADETGATVMRDQKFWLYLYNTMFMMLGLPIIVFGSLLLAMALNRKLPFTYTLRTVYYLPTITPLIGIALIWFWIFNPEYGLIDITLRSLHAVHLPHWMGGWSLGPANPPNWLGDTVWAKPAFVLIDAWGSIGGFTMLLYLAALQGIPRDYYEAAEIDGASAFRRFWNITWPLLGPVNFFVITTSIIAGFHAFGMQYVMTGGGPAGSTTTVAYYIFNNAFAFAKMGYACAIAWVLFFIIFMLTMLQWKFRGVYTYQYD